MRRARTAAAAAVFLVLAAAPTRGVAQGAPALVRGYALNVAGVSGGSAFAASGAADVLRLRLMSTPALGVVRFDLALEQLATWEQRSGTGLVGPGAGAEAATGDWLPLDWTVARGARASWRARFDRLAIAVPMGAASVTVGRQAISWATTLFLTPADPFAPFDPADPFREYRIGVDAVRVQVYPGRFSELDGVVRPADTPGGHTLTAVVRGKRTVGAWDLSAWGGMVYDRAAAAVGVTTTVAGSAVRAEAAVRDLPSSGATLRAAVGVDRRFRLARRDLYVVLEYQHDGFGAARASALPTVLASAPYRRGEMQVLGRDAVAVQASWQVHPLVSTELLILDDVRDGSALLAPAVAYSASEALSLRLGVYAGLGRSATPLGLPASEYGPLPTVGFASASFFF